MPASKIVAVRDSAAEPFDAELAARICWHYFKEGQTQEEVAQRLGLTRKRVNQMIGHALSSGLVQISIDGRFAPHVELEARLTRRYRLRRAIVVPTPAPDADVRTVVGAAAGQYLSETLQPQDSLAIAWGGTLHAAAQNLRRSQPGMTIISLAGGLSVSGPINPYDNAAMFARALGATCRYITAPMIADSEALRDSLARSQQVASVLSAVRKADRALLSAVDLTEQSKALEYGVITRAMWSALRKTGAVGDIAGHYLAADGTPIDHEIVRRTIRVELATLRAIPELILAAGGAHKVPLIAAALSAGLCHVLITDAAAAAGLVDLDSGSSPSLRGA